MVRETELEGNYFSSDPYTFADTDPHKIYSHKGSVLVYEVLIQNNGMALARVHLELDDGTKKSISFPIDVNEGVSYSFRKPIKFEMADIYAHSNTVNVEIQVMGEEL